MYRKQVRRRRAVLVGLIVGSLILLSAHFSEAESGPLHVIQRATATVLSPLEAVANAALKPARDLIDWFDETWEARGENEDLKEELAEVRTRLAEAETAKAENEELRGALDLDKDELAGSGFEPVTGTRHHAHAEPRQRDGRRQRGLGGRSRGRRRGRRGRRPGRPGSPR